jgi:LysM repeat protein
MAFIAGFTLVVVSAFAQDPGAAEDAREERLKILKAADQVEVIQHATEAMRGEVESLKSELVRLREENASLSRDIAMLKSALEKSEAARVKEREVLLAEVGKLVAATPKNGSAAADTKKTDVPPSSREKGYYHTVEAGQTLSAIAAAYREKGVKVTIEDIRKANSLGPNGVIKPGQKLFIPKN